MLGELPPPLAIACHDAGAANIVFEWLRANAPVDARLLVDGPAAALWIQAPVPVRYCASIGELLQDASTLLSGTGWGGDLEHNARRAAQRRGLRSIAVIDHWTNYRERFSRRGETVLPDEFWVTDDDAHALASECFPGYPIRKQPNLYVEEQLRKIAATRLEEPADLLYVLEPVRDEWGRAVPGEFQALDYFMKHAALIALPRTARIRLRSHPSDPPGKYDAWLAKQSGRTVMLDDSPDLAVAIGRATWVAGCESFALVIALLAGRRVICTLPPWAPHCRLPHRGLIHLKSIDGAPA